VEEYGRDWCIRGCHVYHKIWEPEQSDYTARMAHVSHSEMRYRWLLPLLDLLQQLPRMVLRTTMNLLDQEDCYGNSLLKKIRVCNLRGY